MKDYLLEQAWRFLGESGLADKIIVANDGFEIRYRNIPRSARSSKHRITPHQEGSNYYGFVQDYIWAVISLVEDNPKCSIRLTSKCLQMDKETVEHFRRGWEVLANMYKK